MKLQPFLALAHQLADEASAMLRASAASPLAVQSKPDKTFVTALDLSIETRLRELIAKTFPSHGIWGEEFEPVHANAEWVWTLDPIDGTMAFVTGVPVHSTLIALCHDGAPVLGLMNFPATNERWVGVQGEPTTLNGQACRVQACAALSAAVMTASSPDFFTTPDEQRALQALKVRTAWRVYGSAAMAYGRLASGRTQLALDAGLKIYDYAPFAPIIQGAGGVVTDWQGQALTLTSGSQVLAAAGVELHAQARDILAKHGKHPH